MADKPRLASEYKSEQVELVRAACLYVATKLGDLMDDLLIVGGLVPSLIIDQETLGEDVDPHVGTMDLDVGLQLALLNEGRYRELSGRLRDAGFKMDTNDAGKPTRQRWAIGDAGTVTLDFLIQPSREGDEPGRLRDLEADFAAIIAPGLRCAFRDRKRVTLQGTTLFGEKATREVWVSDAGAYVVLKALAFDSRGENKDAYDLFYVVRNYRSQRRCTRARRGAGESTSRAPDRERSSARPLAAPAPLCPGGALQTGPGSTASSASTTSLSASSTAVFTAPPTRSRASASTRSRSSRNSSAT
jgi:hypothetical protein